MKERAWQHDGRKEATKRRAEKKEKHIATFKLILLTEIHTVYEFLCTCNAVSVTYTAATAHEICDGLLNWFIFFYDLNESLIWTFDKPDFQ